MSSPAAGAIAVRGGAGGIAARVEDLDALAAALAGLAAHAADLAWALHGELLRLDLSGCSVLDPAGASRCSVALLAALDGAHGLSWCAARTAALAGAVALAAQRYRLADQLPEPLLAAAHAPGAVWSGLRVALSTGNGADALQAALSADPDLADLAVDALGGPGDLTGLGALFPDGRPVVHPSGPDPALDALGPPRSLPDLIAGLAHRDDGADGEIDVRIATGSRGRRHVVVDLPGTKSWSPSPVNHDVTDLGSCLRALDGRDCAYQDGVLQAMHDAGVQPGDDITLVGHSLGGMVAVDLAGRLAASGYAVGHVITAGSPIGTTVGRVPRRVQVLALENRGDVVPHLDGRANPDRAGVTTVTVEHDDGHVLDDHDLRRSYLPGAADVQASDDASVRAYLAGLAGLFDATTIRTQTFVITRSYR